MKLQIEFSNSQAGPGPLYFGPFDYVQLTYIDLRVSPNGGQLAWFDTINHVWHVQPDPEVREQQPSLDDWIDETFTDIVISEWKDGSHATQ